jgi:putative ABC transport system ATP-binding protein
MIHLEQLYKTFEAGKPAEVIALNGISMHVAAGEFIVLLGSNGSGKSTLMNAIAGSTQLDKGKITIDGIDVTTLRDFERSRWVARIFQNPLQGTSPELTILENFRLASLRTKVKSLSIGTTKAFHQKVSAEVATLGLGLENKLDQPMGTLSGGQRQALALLMAVMDEPRILLLDEPTAALDPRTSEVIMNLANKIIREHRLTAILITHQLKDALHFGDRLVLLSEGKISKDVSGDQRSSLTSSDLLAWFGV